MTLQAQQPVTVTVAVAETATVAEHVIVPVTITAKLLPTPFVVAIDDREKAPYTFAGLVSDVRERSRPLVVRTQVSHMETGDYTIVGYEDRISVERKSLDDLFGTIGQNRARFERELDRLSRLCFAAVVVEASWETILTDPPPYSRLLPKTVFRSVIAWQQRYQNVHWNFMGSRRLAEVTTFRILERYWKTVVKQEVAL